MVWVNGVKWCNKCKKLIATDQSSLDTLVAAAMEAETLSIVNTAPKSLANEIKACSKDNNGIISIPTGGRPMQLLQLPLTDSPSSQANQRTLDLRSTIIVNVIEAVSTKRTRSDDDKEKDMIAQLVHLMKKPKIKRYDHERLGTIE